MNSKFEGITLNDLPTVGDGLKVPEIEEWLNEVSTAIKEWRQLTREANLDVNRATSKRIALDTEICCSTFSRNGTIAALHEA